MILLEMRSRWSPEQASHLSDERQERMVAAWAKLRLMDKYETEFARDKRTIRMSDLRMPVQSGESPPADFEDEAAPRRLSDLERHEIAALVERLPEKQRAVVKLLLYDGLTQQEAADRLGVSQPAVFGGYRRARESLREMLGEYAGASR